MMTKFQIGDKVKIKESAFSNTSDQEAISWRGKEGVIIFTPLRKNGLIRVQLGNGKDDYAPVYDFEIEKVEKQWMTS